MTIGRVLKLIRTHKNYSQAEMARKLDVTQNFLSQVENSKKNLSQATLSDFANKLAISKEILTIAGCDIPQEFQDEDRQKFIDMQKFALKVILLEQPQTT